MTAVAIVATKGSPGATTTAVALAAVGAADGPLPIVIEADLSGGSLALDTLLSPNRGLISLAAAARRGLTLALIDEHAHRRPNDTAVLIAPTSGRRTKSALVSLNPGFGAVLPFRPGLAVIDCGRWEGDEAVYSLVSAADLVLVMLRPTIAGVEQARNLLAELDGLAQRVELVCIGDRPYHPHEVARALGLPRVLSLADDSRSATVVRSGAALDRWLRRSPLIHSTRQLLDDIVKATSKKQVSA